MPPPFPCRRDVYDKESKFGRAHWQRLMPFRSFCYGNGIDGLTMNTVATLGEIQTTTAWIGNGGFRSSEGQPSTLVLPHGDFESRLAGSGSSLVAFRELPFVENLSYCMNLNPFCLFWGHAKPEISAISGKYARTYLC